MTMHPWIEPRWAAPRRVRALISTRAGGASRPPFDSLNLGSRVGDDPAALAENRARVRAHLPAEPLWLRQVHGTRVVEAGEGVPQEIEADAAVARAPGAVLAVLTADCLPVLLADGAGTAVGIAHAGWRGMAGGVIENTLRAMAVPAAQVVAYLGPAIGPQAYEVGEDVRAAFVADDASAARAFAPRAGKDGKYLADLYQLARLRLQRQGVSRIDGGDRCTFGEAGAFFSFRREPRTGRMASFIWMDND